MAGLNTTGKTNPDQYEVGRGRLMAALLDVDGAPIEYRDLGNCPVFTTSIAVEKLEHRSSREGLSTIDKEVVISQDLNLSFQLDEFNQDNLALLFAGEVATYTNATVAGFAKYAMIPSAKLGRWYEIKDSNGQRAYNVDIADLTLEVGVTALTVDVDFELDAENGMIFLRSTAVDVADTDQVDVTLAADAGGKSVTEVRGLTVTSKELSLKFLAENPANNDIQDEYTFHKVRVTSDGDTPLISDEFKTMGFSGAAVKNEIYSPNSPVVTHRHVDQT